jgi:hypothetical protein
VWLTDEVGGVFAGRALVLAAIGGLHSDHATVDTPYLDDTLIEALSCLLDCRRIVGAIHDHRRSGDVIVSRQFVNPIR